MYLLDSALKVCHNSTFIYKFISANDVGITGSHQSGLYMPVNSWLLFFDAAGLRGENRDEYITITWNDEITTDSRFIWYGRGTRSEYRLTRFGRGFPYLGDDNVGSLFILTKTDDNEYLAYILDSDDDIERFLAEFELSPLDLAGVVGRGEQTATQQASYTGEELFAQYFNSLTVEFPTTVEMSLTAQEICSQIYRCSPTDPDQLLLKWLETEYDLFKFIENRRYSGVISDSFENIEHLLEFANTILNRRKSRAGRSLENHLASMFNHYKIPFSQGQTTEGNKRPDFIFPDIDMYHEPSFPVDNLIFLGAKTTCKDRWRQILNEADRIKLKHLFTLQQGISRNQLGEMEEAGVQLVVPEPHREYFPDAFRDKIINLEQFITLVQNKTGTGTARVL